MILIDVFEENMLVSSIHIQRCSPTLPTTDTVHIKTIMRYYFISTRTATIKKIITYPNEGRETGTQIYF